MLSGWLLVLSGGLRTLLLVARETVNLKNFLEPRLRLPSALEEGGGRVGHRTTMVVTLQNRSGGGGGPPSILFCSNASLPTHQGGHEERATRWIPQQGYRFNTPARARGGRGVHWNPGRPQPTDRRKPKQFLQEKNGTYLKGAQNWTPSSGTRTSLWPLTGPQATEPPLGPQSGTWAVATAAAGAISAGPCRTRGPEGGAGPRHWPTTLRSAPPPPPDRECNGVGLVDHFTGEQIPGPRP